MKTRLPWILLAVSLAFNVFFIGGFLQAHCHRKEVPPPGGRLETLAKNLNLDAAQRQVFEQLRGELEQHRSEFAAKREAFINELVKDKPNQKILEEFFVGKDAKQQRLAMLGLMQRFVKILTPAQRGILARELKRPRTAPQ